MKIYSSIFTIPMEEIFYNWLLRLNCKHLCLSPLLVEALCSLLPVKLIAGRFAFQESFATATVNHITRSCLVVLFRYARDWRYHKEERLWLTRAPGVEPQLKTSSYERGTYYFFDCSTWRKVAKEFHLEYDKLDDKPTLQSVTA